jgi:hypothetical protein
MTVTNGHNGQQPDVQVAGSNINVVLTGKETVVLEDRPIPECPKGYVLVKVMATGMYVSTHEMHVTRAERCQLRLGPVLLYQGRDWDDGCEGPACPGPRILRRDLQSRGGREWTVGGR